MASQSPKPRDFPATKFKSDHYISKLPNHYFAAKGDKEKDQKEFDEIGPEFSIVLVAGWPPDIGLLENLYNTFIEDVKSCFDEDDLVVPAAPSSLQVPAVYTYPVQHLHVTVAAFHTMQVGTDSEEHREQLTKYWRNIVVSASKRKEWPKNQSLKLKVKGAQIGERAGILLWEETTGGLDSIRRCLAEETEQQQTSAATNGINVETLSIPQIVHSTFLRFGRVPVSDGDAVQRKFQNSVIPELLKDFSEIVVNVDNTKLVCERTPYMHIPYNGDHVFEEFDLKK